MKKMYLLLLASLVLFSCEKEEIVEVLPPSVNVTSDEAQGVVPTEGFYVMNEGWFPYDGGSMNYFKKNGANYDINYNVYAKANANAQMGMTSCDATFWGDRLYITSKQGERLIVADAKTLKKEMSIEELGGDGRAFLGIDEKKAYVGLDKGIVVFDLTTNQLGKTIEGVAEEQIGNMVYSLGHVFAISAKHLYIIDAQTNTVNKTVDGAYRQMTLDRNGNVFVGGKDRLYKVNGQTLAIQEFVYPEGTAVADSWGMWNVGGMCYSMKTNSIYWTGGAVGWGGPKSVVKMNLDTYEIKTIYTLGNSDRDEQVSLEMYGAGLRVDPLTDELILMAIHSGFQYLYNYIYKLDADGKEIMHFEVFNDNGEPYYWFPALPMFADTNAPQILVNAVELVKTPSVEINLKEAIVDYDDIFASMVITVESQNTEIAKVSINNGILKVEAGEVKGKTECNITVVSNGVKVSKAVAIEVK